MYIFRFTTLFTPTPPREHIVRVDCRLMVAVASPPAAAAIFYVRDFFVSHLDVTEYSV